MDGVDIFEFPGSRVPYLPDYRNGCTPRHRRIPSRASENVDSISPSLFGPFFSHAFPGPLHYFPLSIQPFFSPLQKKERKEKAAVGICIKSFHFGGHVTVLEFFWVEMSSPSKRRDMDVMKLMMSDHAVETINDGINEFNVEFHGPKESLYEGGVWKVRVELPDAYPYKSPSIGFLNKIFHPNVDELSGSVCLDVINQSWSPMFDLLNVFEVFLPQLLLYPNPTDPLNGDAASLMMRDQQQYEQKVKEYCERYAKRVNTANSPAEDSSDDDDISDCQSTGFSDDDVAGHADP